MDHCPACEREFKGITDFPLVYVASFTRSDLSKLSVYHITVFFGPNSKMCNERPPALVLDFFRDRTAAAEFFHEGWKWTLEGEWDRGLYRRENPDHKAMVVGKISPYLDSLEKLVGKEAPIAQIMPPFPQGGYFKDAYFIPDSSNHLMFDEKEKSPSGLRVSEIHLMGRGPNLGSAGGPTIQSLAKLGVLEYEGRIHA